MLLKAPELELTKEQAGLLAGAAAEVAKHYPTKFDPKIAAWVNLGMTAAMVYGPKVLDMRARKRGAPRRSADIVAPSDAHGDMSMFAGFGEHALTM